MEYAHLTVAPAADTSHVDVAAVGRRVLDEARFHISAMAESLQTDGALHAPFLETVTLLVGLKGRLIATGVGKSGIVARKIAATLKSTGTPALFMNAGDSGHGDIGDIQPGDAVLALSRSGNTKELGIAIAHAKRFGNPLIGMTMNCESILGRNADIRLILPLHKEASDIDTPSNSTTLQIALGDALSIATLEAKGFTNDHFRIYHPQGAIGANLTRVSEVMSINARAIVQQTMTVREADEHIQGDGVMVVNIDGVLVGYCSNADYRRRVISGTTGLSDDECAAIMVKRLKDPIETIMTRNPDRITRDRLAGEALAIMDDVQKVRGRTINQLPVVDETNRPIGSVTRVDLQGLQF